MTAQLTLSLKRFSRHRRQDPAAVSTAYSDADLYRLIVAQALTSGVVSSKEELDNFIRGIGNLPDADEIIKFSKVRPGCRAWRHGTKMMCDCGVSWQIGSSAPFCKKSLE